MSEVARNCLSTIRGVALFPVGAGTAGTKPFGLVWIVSPLGQDPGRLHQALKREPADGRGQVLPEQTEKAGAIPASLPEI